MSQGLLRTSSPIFLSCIIQKSCTLCLWQNSKKQKKKTTTTTWRSFSSFCSRIPFFPGNFYGSLKIHFYHLLFDKWLILKLLLKKRKKKKIQYILCQFDVKKLIKIKFLHYMILFPYFNPTFPIPTHNVFKKDGEKEKTKGDKRSFILYGR